MGLGGGGDGGGAVACRHYQWWPYHVLQPWVLAKAG